MKTLPAVIVRNLTDLRFALRPTTVFLLWFALLDLLLFGPVIAGLLSFITRSSGQAAVSNYDLTAFFLSTRGFVFLGVAGAAKLALLFAEMGGLTLIALATIGGQSAKVSQALWRSLSRLPRFAKLGLLQVAIGTGLWLPFLLIALLVKRLYLGDSDINYYLAIRPPEFWKAVAWLSLVGTLTTAVHVSLLARWALAIPVVLVEGHPPRQALRTSWGRTRGQSVLILLQLGTWWLAVWSLFAVTAWLARPPLEWAEHWAGFDLARLLPVILLAILGGAVATVAWACLALNGHQWIVTRLYLRLSEMPPRQQFIQETTPAPPKVLRRWRLAAWTVLGLGAAGATFSVVRSLDRMPADDQVAITAHRGSSRTAPENTLAAIRQAIEDGADYAEIDVQSTSDGHLVVLHDGDLMRVAGDPRRIETLTLAQIQQVDVGAAFGDAFRGEHVPTLDEAIEMCRGKLRLNIELKYNRPDPLLASNVVELVNRNAFTNQCVITSLDYSALRSVEAMAPDLPTGLIVTAVVGDVTRTEADFLSLNSARATPTLVSLAHRRGKGVHVWTVNTEREMQEMIERGVDNIITDEPATLAALRRARAELGPATRLALRLRTLWLPTAPPSPGNEGPPL